jgi:hypothetical protein
MTIVQLARGARLEVRSDDKYMKSEGRHTLSTKTNGPALGTTSWVASKHLQARREGLDAGSTILYIT